MILRLLAALTCTALLAGCGHASPGPGSSPAGGSAASASATRSTPAAASAASASAVAASIPSGDWPAFGYDAAHSGAAPASGITAANARSLVLRRVSIDATGDSAPIELQGVTVAGRPRDVVIVSGTNGATVAIDAGTGARLWEFRPAGPSSTVTNATPVADPGRSAVYAASPDGVVHKLSLSTGRQLWARTITDDPSHEKIASALTVAGANVIAVTGGYYGDAPAYDGHVAAISRATGQIAHVWNTECSGRHQLIAPRACAVTSTRGGNAIWSRAGAVIEPGTHRILITTGNGPFDGRSDWGDSVLELTPDASRLLHNWTPVNQRTLFSTDTDLGSTSPALLPGYHGRRLAVQGGKQGVLSLLDLDRLDGSTEGAGARLGGQLQQISAPGGQDVFTQPAVWRDGSRILLFAATNAGTAAYELEGGAAPRLHMLWQDGTSATSPVVSGGLLYAYDQSDGKLFIRQPLSGATVRVLPVATGHWNSPIVVGGRIIETTGDYHAGSGPSTLEIWHLPGR